MTNPIWVIKTRMQLQRRQHAAGMHVRLRPPMASAAAQSATPPPYRGFVHAVKEIARQEGFKGFYRGLGPSLLMVSALGHPASPPHEMHAACHQMPSFLRSTAARSQGGVSSQLLDWEEGCPRTAL